MSAGGAGRHGALMGAVASGRWRLAGRGRAAQPRSPSPSLSASSLPQQTLPPLIHTLLRGANPLLSSSCESPALCEDALGEGV